MARRLSVLAPALVLLACGESGRAGNTYGLDTYNDSLDGDSEDGPVDDMPGDGDPDPTTTGDGDGDPDPTTGDGDGDPDPTTGDGDGDPGPSCSQHAAAQNWGAFYCDNGNGICAGDGIPTADCDLCCSGPSCGEYADQQDWDWANCEWNGNGACNGQGTPTYDCDFCCGEGGGGETTTGDGDGDPNFDGFGYPVGDKTSYPAGGWQVWQVMGHYWGAYGGRHLAQDIAAPGGGNATIDAPVYAVADGVVRYAGTNGSSYKNVVLVEHDDGEGGKVCSFFGHIHNLAVATGQNVTRGQKLAEVINWANAVNNGSPTNTHLHYVLLSKPLCDASANANGALICGYDNGGYNEIDTLAEEPYFYTAISDDCGDWQYSNSFISPTQFIEDHHF